MGLHGNCTFCVSLQFGLQKQHIGTAFAIGFLGAWRLIIWGNVISIEVNDEASEQDK